MPKPKIPKDVYKEEQKETFALSRKTHGLSMVASKIPGVSASRVGGLTDLSHWIEMMRDFHEGAQPICRTLQEKTTKADIVDKQFPTGSTYYGTWTVFGNGSGTFVFPTGTVSYEGSFEDGSFHGDGYLTYDNGVILKGQWAKGFLTDRKLVFADGLEFDEIEWNYCCPRDRRYTVEYDFGIEPAGRSYITSQKPPIAIPEGYYDAGDGFYDPVTCSVYKYDDLTAIIRYPQYDEQMWIMRNCRTNPEEFVGPCTFLYQGFLPPTLEFEVPPPPAARTKTYLSDSEDEGDFYEDEADERHWRKMRFSRTSRASRTSSMGASSWKHRITE